MISNLLQYMSGRAVALDDEKSFRKVQIAATVLYPVLLVEAVAGFLISKIVRK